jgi:hypothetical protein
LIATTADAKVLRNKNNARTVWVFKDADALGHLGKVANATVDALGTAAVFSVPSSAAR